MLSFKTIWSRIALSLYFGLSGFLVLLTVDAKANHLFHFLTPFSLGIILACLHSAIYFFVLSGNRNIFVKLYTAGAFAAALSTIILTFLVYQELLRSMFHVIGAFMLILTFRYEYFRIPGRLRDNAKTLMYILVCVEVCVSIWVLLHAVFGILIATESAAKWVLLNAYTAGYLFFGVFAIKSSRELMNRRVVLNENLFSVDETDYTPLFGAGDLLILTFFARKLGGSVTCAEIHAGCAKNLTERESRQATCAVCKLEHHKATLCADYRRIYNQVLKIKKILETLRVGTIVQPQNKMDIILEGWSLEVFQSVTIIEKA